MRGSGPTARGRPRLALTEEAPPETRAAGSGPAGALFLGIGGVLARGGAGGLGERTSDDNLAAADLDLLISAGAALVDDIHNTAEVVIAREGMVVLYLDLELRIRRARRLKRLVVLDRRSLRRLVVSRLSYHLVLRRQLPDLHVHVRRRRVPRRRHHRERRRARAGSARGDAVQRRAAYAGVACMRPG